MPDGGGAAAAVPPAQLNTNSKKQTMQTTAKQNYPCSVTSYSNQPGNKMGLFYNAPEPTRALGTIKTQSIHVQPFSDSLQVFRAH